MDPSLFAAALERQDDGVFIIRMNPEQPLRPYVVYANPAFFRLTGFGAADIANGAYPALLGVETDRALVLDCARRVAAGQAVECELRLYRKNATPFWASVRSHPLDDAGRHCVLMLRDIEERRSTGERLRLLSRALEEASDLVLICDATPPSAGGPFVVFANQSFLDATGYAPADVLGRPVMEIYAPDNDPAVVEAVRHNVERGLRNDREVLLRRKDGSEFWVEFVAKPFDDPVEHRTYRIAIGRDITLRKRAANQVSLLLAAAEASNDRIALYELGDDGTLAPVYENPAALDAGRHRLLELTKAMPLDDVLEKYGGANAEEGDFAAHAIRNVGGTIEAVITVEPARP